MPRRQTLRIYDFGFVIYDLGLWVSSDMIGRRLAVVLALLLVSVSTARGEEPSADARFLAGLRQRGLSRLGEAYCTERLARANLSLPQRAELTVELSRCVAEQALGSPPELRPPLWQRAIDESEKFARQFPGHPRLLLVRFQAALVTLARGELARQEARLGGGQGNLIKEAKTHLRAAIRQLRELVGEVERKSRELPTSRPDDPDALRDYQLAALKKNLQYELARALRNQAQCYPAGSADRTNSLSQAVELLQPLAGIRQADSLVWDSRIDRIVCYRLMADYATSRRLIDALLVAEPPPSIELRVRAEGIHLMLAAGQPNEALRLIQQGRQLDGVGSAWLDYAHLATYLSAWQAANEARDQVGAARWQDLATDTIRVIAAEHGPYWTRRAEMLLAGYVRAAPEAGNMAMLVRAAESAFRSGNHDEAIAAYDRAEQLAAAEGNPDRAFELGYIAATVEHRRKRHAAARDRYRRVAVGRRGHLNASEAHLLAVYHAGELLRAEQGRLEDYATLMHEHLQLWPNEPTADRVHRRLGLLYEHRRQWELAVGAYRAVSPSHAEFDQVVEAAERCYRKWLDGLRATGEPAVKSPRQIADEAAGWFRAVIVGPQNIWPQRWSPAQRASALAEARIRLNYTPDGHAQASLVLDAALQHAAEAQADWVPQARALLVFSLAGQGKHREAAGVLAQVSAASPEELLDLLEGLSRTSATASDRDRTNLAQLQLEAIRLLQDGPALLNEAQQESLMRRKARALEDAGHIEEALAACEALAAANPDDGGLQESCARLLMAAEDDASLQKARAKWRDVEKRSPPESPRWFRAKFYIAELHYRLGANKPAAQRQAANEQVLKIIALLELLHPELGGKAMRAQFDELKAKCQQ